MDHLRKKFIVFDGNEGCGKSTQARMLQQTLEKAGIPTKLVRDPGTTRIGELIREILLDPANTDMSMRCEMLLYMAAQAQMMTEIIQPALEEGRTVISDRFISSTLAYQLGGDGLTEADILAVGQVAINKHWPDMTIILDLPVRESPKFALFSDDPTAGDKKDRIELRSMEYHEKVRQNYLRQSKIRRGTYHILEAVGGPEKVHAEVMRLLSSIKSPL